MDRRCGSWAGGADRSWRECAAWAAKERRLLAVLALHLGEAVSQDQLAEALWGEHAPRSAANALQNYGASALVMAQAYPRSHFVGFDYHQPSVRHAQQVAASAGLAERCRFEVAPASAYPGDGYDLVAVFDALHDMGDPVGAAAHIRQTLAPDGPSCW